MKKNPLDSLESQNDCVVAENFLNDVKDELLHKQQNVDYESKDDEKTSKELSSALGVAVVEYNSAVSAHEGETDADKKERLYTKRIRAEVKVRSIRERLTDSGPLAAYKSAYENNELTANLAWVDQQLAAVTAKKATLPA